MERNTNNNYGARRLAGEMKLFGLTASLSLLTKVQTVRLLSVRNLGYLFYESNRSGSGAFRN